MIKKHLYPEVPPNRSLIGSGARCLCGAYLIVCRDNRWLALIYPSIGFAIWHFALQSIIPFRGSGGRVSLVVAVGFLGLLWAWAANSTPMKISVAPALIHSMVMTR